MIGKVILFILFFFIFIGLFFGFSVSRFLFGASSRQNRNKSGASQSQRTTSKPSSKPAQKKIIKPDEGEYVDFEEIKD
ncbi:MAG: DUF4834 family protein [Dysgonamonadaceae bacterium]|jgi:hypothetical protein|nr:DUF4834 family protein [Dysgonamonadaceae bacterium]